MGSYYDDFGVADRVYRMAEDHASDIRQLERQNDRLIYEVRDLRVENEALKLENMDLQRRVESLEATLRASSIPGWDDEEPGAGMR